jgi:hypothetical protein
MRIKKGYFALFFVFILLAGCVADGSRMTAKEVLKHNLEADIFQYDGFIYSNISKVEWFKEEKRTYIKQILLGKIQKQSTSSFGFNNLTATKLPVGAKIYSTSKKDKASGILIVEYKGKDLYYMKLLEG